MLSLFTTHIFKLEMKLFSQWGRFSSVNFFHFHDDYWQRVQDKVFSSTRSGFEYLLGRFSRCNLSKFTQHSGQDKVVAMIHEKLGTERSF